MNKKAESFKKYLDDKKLPVLLLTKLLVII